MSYAQDQRLSDYQKLTAQQDWADRCDEMSSEPASPKPQVIKCDTGDGIRLSCAQDIWHPEYGLVKIYDPVYFEFADKRGYSYESAIGVIEVTEGKITIWKGHHRCE